MAKRSEKDFHAEIETHIAHEADRLVEEGMAREEAEALARRTFGNRTAAAERFYEGNRWLWWEGFRQDARFALRTWRRQPALAAVVVVSLSVGIAASTVIFSAVDTLLLKELPYRDANRLMYVGEYWPKEPVVPGPPSADFANWRSNAKLVERMAAYGGGAAMTLTGDGEPERIQGTAVTQELLSLLDARMVLGRNFNADEDRPGGVPVAILGHGLWQRRFGGALDAVGKRVVLNGVPRTIVGVLPPSFRFPDNNFREDLLIPMGLPPNPNWQDERNFRFVRVLARARPGVSPEAVRQEFAELLRVSAGQEPAQMVRMRKDLEVRVTPLRQWLTGSFRNTLLSLAGAVAMVLLIACLNIASLQVAALSARTREMALRASTGATTLRLIRQLLTENLLLTMFAGLLALALAHAGLGSLRWLLPENLHLASLIAIDYRVLLFALATTCGAGVVTGLAPALAASRVDCNEVLKDGSQQTAGTRKGRRWQSALVVGEVAVAMMLLLGTVMLIRAFERLTTEPTGFDAPGVLTVKVAPSSGKYPQSKDRAAFYEAILDRARLLPGVRMAAIGGGLPMAGSPGAAGVSFRDRPEPPLGGRPSIPVAFVSTDYFKVLGIPLLEGRAFQDSDRGGAPLVAIVNQAFAEKYFPGESAVGKQIEFGSRQERWREIVGVAGNVRQSGQNEMDPFQVFGTLQESFEFETFLALKTNVAPESLVTAVKKMVESIDPHEPVFSVATMEDRLEASRSGPRAAMTLMTLLAGMALSLAGVGIFGVVAYYVGQRQHEIAIRMALGATGRSIVGNVLWQGMVLVVSGIMIGAAGALALARTLEAAVRGFGTADGTAFAIAGAVFLAVSVAACVAPARWAAQVDPAAGMRRG